MKKIFFFFILFLYINSVQASPIGEQSVAVILLDYVQNKEELQVEEIHKAVFTSEYSVHQFINESSYGKSWLSGDTYGWYKDPSKVGHCHVSIEDVFKVLGKSFNYKKYSRYLVMTRFDREKCSDVGLGHSDFGLKEIQTPQGQHYASFSWISLNYRLTDSALPFQKISGITNSVVAHELGHAFGIRGHANLYDCGQEAISKKSSDCVQEAIADRFSIMGGEGVYRVGLHHNACHKEDLGWLESSQIITIDPSQKKKHQIQLYPYAMASYDGPVVIKLPLKNKIPVNKKAGVYLEALYITNRLALGFDRRMRDLEDPRPHFNRIALDPKSNKKSFKINYSGVQVRGGFFLNQRCVTTYLIDSHPSTIGSTYQDKFYDYSLYDALDSTLNKGEFLTEPYNNIHISVRDINKDGSVDVEIF